MKLILAYDTETTGLPLFNEPSSDPRQPHIVQLAAVLLDLDTRKPVMSMNVIVRPDGWTIPDDVSAVHGITTEYAATVGIPEAVAVAMFMELWGGGVRVAHNESFDARILRIALKRFVGDEQADVWKAGSAECTARLSTPICKLPPTKKMVAARRTHFKTSNLGEAYRHFFGKDFENAHTAMADVKACIDVYFAIQDQRAEA